MIWFMRINNTFAIFDDYLFTLSTEKEVDSIDVRVSSENNLIRWIDFFLHAQSEFREELPGEIQREEFLRSEEREIQTGHDFLLQPMRKTPDELIPSIVGFMLLRMQVLIVLYHAQLHILLQFPRAKVMVQCEHFLLEFFIGFREPSHDVSYRVHRVWKHETSH